MNLRFIGATSSLCLEAVLGHHTANIVIELVGLRLWHAIPYDDTDEHDCRATVVAWARPHNAQHLLIRARPPDNLKQHMPLGLQKAFSFGWNQTTRSNLHTRKPDDLPPPPDIIHNFFSYSPLSSWPLRSLLSNDTTGAGHRR